MTTVHDFLVKTIDGHEVSLSQYQGKALLIVNTASECGFTPQYQGLQALYERTKGKGFEVLAFPSNDFGAQEPGTEAQIKTFCETTYQTTFPLFAKVAVKGSAPHPLYAHLQSHPKGAPVKWNFAKFLVNPKGEVAGAFDSKVTPESQALATAIARVLPGAMR